MLVMPGVHNFEGSSWGWHKVGDLLVVVNNLFNVNRHGKEIRMKSDELFAKFIALAKNGKDIRVISVWGRHGLAETSCCCASDYISDDNCSFVPAAWGIAIINAVKNGIRRVELKDDGTSLKRWGIMEDGSSLCFRGSLV